MKIRLNERICLLKGTSGDNSFFDPGNYTLEIISNPYGVSDKDWIVIAGTPNGATIEIWRHLIRRKSAELIEGELP